jgi:hypothetical protein
MSDDFVNMHKRIAMGQAGAETHLKRGGKVSKYAKGGSVSAVPEKSAQTLLNDSSQKLPYPKPGAKIATMKKGGHAKGGLTIAIVAPMKKSVGRGR